MTFDLSGKRVWVAGHRGMVGGAVVRRLASEDCEIITAGRDVVDLTDQAGVDRWMEKIRPDAIVLAAAGVKRLGLENKITEFLDENIMLPAVGQGALCIEVRENDPEVAPIVAKLEHPQTRTIVMGERAFLNRLEGGCQVPIGSFSQYNGSILYAFYFQLFTIPAFFNTPLTKSFIAACLGWRPALYLHERP